MFFMQALQDIIYPPKYYMPASSFSDKETVVTTSLAEFFFNPSLACPKRVSASLVAKSVAAL